LARLANSRHAPLQTLVKNRHFVGGLPGPKLGKNISFTVHRQIADEDGLMNPIAGEPAVEGSFQINSLATAGVTKSSGGICSRWLNWILQRMRDFTNIMIVWSAKTAERIYT
jgi:hypothetical protein